MRNLFACERIDSYREISQANSKKKNPDAKAPLLRENARFINTRQHAEYSDDVETLWDNFKTLINQRVKKDNQSLTQTYKVLEKIRKWGDEEGGNINLRKQEQ
ncbi:714_t:CDS:2 [Paraglomus brasilianum]|uniref:714_t:CDS:1 n=1 Tax=Paraglomus brasilianum TaxID=144538 RepID=A0A9N8WPJ4_9GLOM|nr:714_t:CDS:2 [Paraglomus brasilianum]